MVMTRRGGFSAFPEVHGPKRGLLDNFTRISVCGHSLRPCKVV